MIHAAMFTGTPARCGVGVYARDLVVALAPLARVTTVEGRFGPATRAEYRRMGAAMNAGKIAHVQHAYAFWGGMAPHRIGFACFLGAIQRPVVLTVHELDDAVTGAYRLPASVERAYKRLVNRRTFGADSIRTLVVHAPALKRGLEKLGIPAGRIRLLPMPAPRVTRAESDAAFRARWGLEGRLAVTLFGFLARRKGYPTALDALARLPESVTLLIAGDAHPADRSDPRAWLEAEVAARGLTERVRFLGYVPDAGLPDLMRASDVVLAPFTAMSASASIHLALAHGRPVVASDLEANRLLPPLTLFPAGDPDALAAAVEALRHDPARREALGNAALTYAAENGFERLASETAAIYQGILKHPNG